MRSEHFSNKRENFATFSEFLYGAHNQFIIKSIEDIIREKAKFHENPHVDEDIAEDLELEEENSAIAESADIKEDSDTSENSEIEEEIDSGPTNFILLKGATAGGKTHLLEATATLMKELAPDAKVLLAQARELIAFFTDQKKFSKKIQELENVDLLLIDDVHLIANDRQCQEELRQLLDVIDRRNALAVTSYSTNFDLANQSNLKEAIYLDQSLYSRLSSGIILNIYPPDLDITMQFAQRESEKLKLNFTKSMCLTLARFCYDIRQLQGLLKTIEKYIRTNKIPFTDTSLLAFLKDYEGKKEITIDLIISYTAQYFALQVKDLKGKSRLSHIVEARQMSMYLCRKLLGYSYPRIAKVYGGKDHTTIIYACSKIEKDPRAQSLAHNLSQKILLESSFTNMQN